MATRRARRGESTRRRGERISRLRAGLAVALLASVVAVAAWIAVRGGRQDDGAGEPGSGVEAILDVAERAGCGRDALEVERSDGAAGVLWDVTVRAPAGFDLQRFVLGVQAAAHNGGGRMESLPLAEGGGYGLARLEGEMGGAQVRVVVLGERPRRARRRSLPAGSSPPRLAVVLDDAGNSLDVVAAVASLPPEVAIAVLPNAPQSAATARALGAAHREVMLHMPMEPLPGAAPGPGEGALSAGQDAETIRELLDRALRVVAGARGVNNHMGSLATADRRLMKTFMGEVHRRGLYFIDSRTTPNSVALEAAREAGVPAAERDVFLDVVEEPAAIRRALARAVSEARATGRALAIGHVHAVTIATLAAELPLVAADGVRLVPPSRLVRSPG